MLPIPPRDESADGDNVPEPPNDAPKQTRNQIQAQWGCVLPLLAWFSQCFLAFMARGVPAEGLLLAALVQLLLILAGLMLSATALARRRPGESGVRVPATLGLLISVGTLLLVVAMAFRLMLL